jgi:hypothetical protein
MFTFVSKCGNLDCQSDNISYAHAFSILKFISAPVFTNELRDRIQSHLSRSADGHLTVDRERLLMSLSHGLRVELARLVWRDFLSKVHLFRGCSGQFLDAVCVLVYENHFGPEEAIGVQHEVFPCPLRRCSVYL